MDAFAIILLLAIAAGVIVGLSMRKRRKPTPEIFRSLHQIRGNHERDNATHRRGISFL